MNIDDFRCMRRGVQLSTLNKNELSLVAPVEQRTNKKQRALLLFHGFSSSPAVYRRLIAALDCYDAIICPALLGHASDLASFSVVKTKDWFLQAEQTYKQMNAEFEQVDVMGLSLGGLLACHLSKQFTLRQLYLLAPALDLQLAIKPTLYLAKTLYWLGFRYIPSAAGDLYASKFCEIAYRQLPLQIIIELLSTIRQFQFSVPSCPTDLFLGRHDKVVSSWQVAERFANHDKVTIHWLENSAHVLPLDGDLANIIACIKKNQGKN